MTTYLIEIDGLVYAEIDAEYSVDAAEEFFQQRPEMGPTTIDVVCKNTGLKALTCRNSK